MRWTIGQVWKHPDRWLGWWEDLPYRTKRWWGDALFAPGEGWLKWDHDYRTWYSYDPPDYESWAVYPPLRRAWFQVKWILQIPYLMRHEHLSWEEVRPDFSTLRADADRKKELWK